MPYDYDPEPLAQRPGTREEPAHIRRQGIRRDVTVLDGPAEQLIADTAPYPVRLVALGLQPADDPDGHPV